MILVNSCQRPTRLVGLRRRWSRAKISIAMTRCQMPVCCLDRISEGGKTGIRDMGVAMYLEFYY